MNEEKKEEGADQGGASEAGAEKSTSEKLIERSEELSRKNDKLQAELDEAKMKLASQELGGRAEAGQPEKKELTEEEKASRARIKAVGDAGGSPWAKNYE